MPRHAKPRQTLAEWLGFTPEPMTFHPLPELSSQSLVPAAIIPAATVPALARPPRGPSGVSRPADPRITVDVQEWRSAGGVVRTGPAQDEPVAGRPEWADVAESRIAERLQLLADRSQSGHPEGVFVWDEFTHAMESGQTGTQWRAFQAGLRAAAKWAARS